MKNECLTDAPRDRHILVLNKIYHFDGYGQPWRHVGAYWVEAWYNPNPTMSPEHWSIWCGTKRTSTTERVDAEAWAELPA